MELKACKLKACANTFSTGTSKRTLISSIVRKGEAIEIKRSRKEFFGHLSACT